MLRPAPLHLLERTIQVHKAIKVDNTVPLASAEARTALVQTFGTKKTQPALRAAEKDKVDRYYGYAGCRRYSTIAAATKGLPSEGTSSPLSSNPLSELGVHRTSRRHRSLIPIVQQRHRRARGRLPPRVHHPQDGMGHCLH